MTKAEEIAKAIAEQYPDATVVLTMAPDDAERVDEDTEFEDDPDTTDSAREMRARSGCVTYSDSLVSLLHDLVRNDIPVGIVELIMEGPGGNDPVSFLHEVKKLYPAIDIDELLAAASSERTTYCNGWLARYMKDVANRLRRDKQTGKAA